MTSISARIELHTAEISNFEKRRDYISLSHALQPKEELLKMYLDGFEDGLMIRLRCYKGYQMERDLVARVKHVLGAVDHPEISCFDGLVKGHPDFMYQGNPGDGKSVPLDEHLPEVRVPRRVYYQVQAYLLYSKKPSALVIYESRESGKIRDYLITHNEAVQNEINMKYFWCVQQIREKSA